jgi:hypothetical protein
MKTSNIEQQILVVEKTLQHDVVVMMPWTRCSKIALGNLAHPRLLGVGSASFALMRMRGIVLRQAHDEVTPFVYRSA